MKTTDTHYITVGDKRYPLIARKHPRARNMVVRCDVRSGVVKLTLPRTVSLEKGVAFAESRAGWIARQMETARPLLFEHEAVIPLLGQPVRLLHIGGRGVVRREENILYVPGEKTFMARRVRETITRETLLVLSQRAAHHAMRLGVGVARVRVRDTHARWGSCSARGDLSFCWRLGLMPLAVLDYVVCHEVAHLKHHNHSAAFWNVVEALCPDYEAHERWLKHHGQEVWRWG